MPKTPRREFIRRAGALTAGTLLYGISPVKGASRSDGRWLRTSERQEAPDDIEPIDAPFAMPQLQRPSFPDRIFDIREYGAEPGGERTTTEAIARAIHTCHEQGGGRVRVPEGTWLTGAVHLKSNVNLQLDEGAVLRFSSDRADYLPAVHTRIEGVEVYNYSPLIYAANCENVAIIGAGTLDGNGAHWWDYYRAHHDDYSRIEDAKRPLSARRYAKGEQGLRPSFVQPWKSTNVLIEGITLRNTPMWTVHPVYCENVIVRDVTIQTLEAPNGDGVNPDSCRNVLIEHCHFETGDDAIAIKSGLNEDGWRVGRPSQNIVVRHINARDVRTGSGGVVIGSETSGDVRNVYVHDCFFEATDRGVRLKSERGRGGVVENLYVRDVEMQDVSNQAININSFYSGGEATGPAPLFRNIDIRNVTVRGAAMGIELIGLPEKWIQNFTLTNVRITADEGVRCVRVQDLSFDDVTVDTEEQGLELFNCADVTLRQIDLDGSRGLLLRGTGAAGIRIDDSIDRSAIAFADGASQTVLQRLD